MTRPAASEVVEVGDLVAGGRAFARLEDGTPLFVAGAIAGERVEVRVERRRARVAEGRATRILEPSPDRVQPSCPWAESCGGCDWMHLEYGAQLRWKGVIAREAALRQARIELDETPVPVPSPAALGYRGRIRVHVDRQGRIGLFAPGTHEVVAVDRCAVAAPPVNDALAALRDAAAAVGADFGRQVSGAELRTGDGATPWAIHLFWRHRRARPSPTLRTALGRMAAGGGAIWAAGNVLEGPDHTEYPLPEGLALRAGPLAFLQANPGANRQLVTYVRDAALALAGPRGRFLDLYCGAGNLTLPLLAAGMTGTGLELSAGAIADARRSAEALALPAEAFEATRVEAYLGRDGGRRLPDLVLLDPPRTGAKDAIEAIADLGARSMLYVSCDPVTLARDLGQLRQRRYEVRDWTAFDLFPQTHHVESVVTLTRGE